MKINTINNKMLSIVFIFLLTLFLIFDQKDRQVYAINYQVVYVKQGDSLWSIANLYVPEKEDIRNYISLLKKINSLDENAQIYPGQELKIPIK